MGTHIKKPKFSSIWSTQTQLGAYFNLTVKEIGQHLVQAGLRVYDNTRGMYMPTEKACAEGFCTLTQLKNGDSFYMWHRQKVSQLLHEQAGLIPLSDYDMDCRIMALQLIAAEKEAAKGNDKVYYLMFDAIPSKKLHSVMAWAILIAHCSRDPIYANLLSSIAVEDVLIIDRELERLGSFIRLGEDRQSDPLEQEDSIPEI